MKMTVLLDRERCKNQVSEDKRRGQSILVEPVTIDIPASLFMLPAETISQISSW